MAICHFAVPNLARNFESYAPTPGPQLLLSLSESWNLRQSQNLYLPWFCFLHNFELRGLTLQASCNPELWSCFVSKWILKMFELFAYLKNNSQFRIFPFPLCVWVFCLQHVCVLRACLVLMEAGRVC